MLCTFVLAEAKECDWVDKGLVGRGDHHDSNFKRTFRPFLPHKLCGRRRRTEEDGSAPRNGMALGPESAVHFGKTAADSGERGKGLGEIERRENELLSIRLRGSE